MVGILGDALLFAVQSQVKSSGTKPLEPTALELGSDGLIKNSAPKTSGLVFAASPGKFNDTESFITVAQETSSPSQKSPGENNNNGIKNKSTAGLDVFPTKTTAAEDRLTQLLSQSSTAATASSSILAEASTAVQDTGNSHLQSSQQESGNATTSPSDPQTTTGTTESPANEEPAGPGKGGANGNGGGNGQGKGGGNGGGFK